MIRPEDLKIPINAKASNKKILQPNDIQKLFSIDHINMYGQQSPAFFIYAFRFILLTGLRRGELCGLKKDEDIIDDILYVRRSFNKFNEETACKNKNAQRYMVLSEHAKSILAQQEQMLKEKAIISPWLFPDENGNQLDPCHFYEKWKTYRNQHGIQCSLHEMRHTMISVAKADVPEQLLKQAVGHSKSMDTFGIYGHKVDGELNRVANILDNIFDTILKQ